MLRLTNKRREEASVKRALTLENEIELIEGCRAGKDSARKELYTLYSKQMPAHSRVTDRSLCMMIFRCPTGEEGFLMGRDGLRFQPGLGIDRLALVAELKV